jgi:hypothetical protein
MNEIERHISNSNYEEAIKECLSSKMNSLGVLLNNIRSDLNINDENFSYNQTHIKQKTTVKLLTNWISSGGLRELWNKMSQGDYNWNNIRIVTDDNPDYFVVLNAPPVGIKLDPTKTIVFQMEPLMEQNNNWGEWSVPDPTKFLKVCSHNKEYNNNVWRLNKTYNELKTEKIIKDSKLDGIISTVLSTKYSYSGQIKRIDFIRHLEKEKLPIHVFGANKWGYVNYKGSDNNSMFPYKYAFNCEKSNVKNYYTDKLIDGILSECLVFYCGCYNIRDIIDDRAFVYLELSNFDDDCKKIRKAIQENLWEERIEIIRKEKFRILNSLQFFPRLERIINKDIK